MAFEIIETKNIKSNLLSYESNVPAITKYMGSKRAILDFVIKALDDNYTGGVVCDLFGGTCILSGALGKIVPMHSNDIQEYSAVMARTYLSDYNWDLYSDEILNEISNKASDYVQFVKKKNKGLDFQYGEKMTIKDFVSLEDEQQRLINYNFKVSHYLFIKYYSGTYWSYEQCLWIDALRKIADDYGGTPLKNVIISSLMYAMSYNSQSTGHYAQYREATDLASKSDILIYRQKEILPYFINKFKQLYASLGANKLRHTITTMDYAECLDQLSPNTLVYADPPYAFVHYSRFYHALETLVKYDYPEVDHKGRYRNDRHQSPFCKATEVKAAFSTLFSKIKNKKSNLVLSYSNTGMITLDEILEIAKTSLNSNYRISIEEVAYKHSTMGRRKDKSKSVSEYLVIANRSQ